MYNVRFVKLRVAHEKWERRPEIPAIISHDLYPTG